MPSDQDLSANRAQEMLRARELELLELCLTPDAPEGREPACPSGQSGQLGEQAGLPEQ
jgi:hypothetical protein